MRALNGNTPFLPGILTLKASGFTTRTVRATIGSAQRYLLLARLRDSMRSLDHEALEPIEDVLRVRCYGRDPFADESAPRQAEDYECPSEEFLLLFVGAPR